MATYIYSKWKQAAAGYPVEFYSELDQRRYETRKIEIFADGKIGHANQAVSVSGTRLGIIPVPPLAELKQLHEFVTEEISATVFEAKWNDVMHK